MKFQEAKKFILAKLKTDLPRHLTYHSVEHVKDVYKAARMLAKTEGVEGADLKLLLTAALFHDSGFIKGPKEHEAESCNIAREHLPAFGYNDEQIDKICGMIMATRIPQTPRNLMEQIICDADLDYLGREDFMTIGNKLFDELCIYGIISDENEWNRLQVKFLQSHNYFTSTALALRKEKKDEHLALVKSQIQ